MTKKTNYKNFINIVEDELLRCPFSQVIPIMNLIAFEYGLKLNRHSEFKIAKKILINSVKLN
jgi:hypothetical protein